MYQDKVIKRQKVLDDRADKIRPDLINEAQEKYIKLVEGTEYHKALVDLQNNGMDYMSALNFVPLESDIKDKESTKAAESHEATQQQIAEQKIQEEPRRILNIFKKATSKIKGNLFPKGNLVSLFCFKKEPYNSTIRSDADLMLARLKSCANKPLYFFSIYDFKNSSGRRFLESGANLKCAQFKTLLSLSR